MMFATLTLLNDESIMVNLATVRDAREVKAGTEIVLGDSRVIVVRESLARVMRMAGQNPIHTKRG